jgi:hypothetical protein
MTTTMSQRIRDDRQRDEREARIFWGQPVARAEEGAPTRYVRRSLVSREPQYRATRGAPPHRFRHKVAEWLFVERAERALDGSITWVPIGEPQWASWARTLVDAHINVRQHEQRAQERAQAAIAEAQAVAEAQALLASLGDPQTALAEAEEAYGQAAYAYNEARMQRDKLKDAIERVARAKGRP